MLEQPVHVALLEANLQLNQLVAIGTVELRPLARREVRLLDGIGRARLDGRRDDGVRSHCCRQQCGREHVHGGRSLLRAEQEGEVGHRGKAGGTSRQERMATTAASPGRCALYVPASNDAMQRPTTQNPRAACADPAHAQSPWALLYEAAATTAAATPPRIPCIPGRYRADRELPRAWYWAAHACWSLVPVDGYYCCMAKSKSWW
jgi:hypothetical protein